MLPPIRVDTTIGRHQVSNVIAGVGVHRSRLEYLLASTQGPVRIASAYVTETRLFTDGSSRDIHLLTALSTMDLVSGATSLDSLEMLIQTGAECRFLSDDPRIHAKVYIFGDESAVVTSANFTARALDSNIEVGIQIRGNEVAEIASWFEELWDSAEPLDTTRLASLRHQTAALHREFSFLRARCDLLDRPGTLPDVATEALPSRVGSSLCYFLCNTDRSHGGYEREGLMRARRYAAAWEDFSHTSHMKAANRGDIIFMYANRVGVIGIGNAVGACQVLEPGDPDMLFEEENSREWRIPVVWLRWVEEGHACPWDRPSPTTFTNVSAVGWSKRRDGVIQRFLGDSAVARDLGF
jgi:hypothetical protein